MSGRGTKTSEKRFAAYLEGLASVIGHADRKAPLRNYCVGLMACGGRKSVEPMAAVTAPERTAAQHHTALSSSVRFHSKYEGIIGRVIRIISCTHSRFWRLDQDAAHPAAGNFSKYLLRWIAYPGGLMAIHA
ncbi:SRSO17 transposase [Bradyrhizobium sp. USDA 4454]